MEFVVHMPSFVFGIVAGIFLAYGALYIGISIRSDDDDDLGGPG